MTLAALFVDVDEIESYCVPSRLGKWQIVSSSVEMNAAIKELQELVVD